MKWIERKFEFDFPAKIYPEFIERLHSTPPKLEASISNVSDEILTKKLSGQWSMQENLGHLLMVESLFIGRLDDYIAGAAELRAAQINGNRTNRADYNSWKIEKIVADFRKIRTAYVKRLHSLGPDFFEKKAWHPRLAQPMRVCDMLYFQAEHDDHHLRKITDLKIMFSVSG